MGTNLAAYLLNKREEVVIIDNLSREGSDSNLDYLNSLGDFKFHNTDIRDNDKISQIISEYRPDTVFHLAGQVAMTASIESPKNDFEINALGTLNILEAVRNYSIESQILYSSTNKVYGDFNYLNFTENDSRYLCTEYPNGFDETLKLDFHSPYGCSKGCADQYILDYARMYGLNTVVFRHSSMYGGNQHPTFDQGWIGWFCKKAIEQSVEENVLPFTISGNGKQVRDVLHADDVVQLYIKARNSFDKIKGKAYNIGGGIENSLSLLELFKILEDILKIELTYKMISPRESDQLVFVANSKEIQRRIGWQTEVVMEDGISSMVNWLTLNI